MSYDRRIIIDFDDTISRTIDRDWENAEPILPVIEKINKLYDNGWEIFIVTARGQLSCNGDFEKADKKYRSIMENWLKKHNVKYHKLTFMKELGAYYVDDKALLPEEFVDLDVRLLKAGWSGASVEKRGNKVYKTHPNVLNEAMWYKFANHFCNVPKVHSVIGKTICLDYIEHDEKNKAIDINKILDIVLNFRNIPTKLSVENYIQRMINRHLNILKTKEFDKPIDFLLKNTDFYNKHMSFCHGDLSLENILIDYNGKHYLIDPIYEPNEYSSWLLDISKLIHSFRKHNNMIMVDYLYNCLLISNIKQYVYVLEITQWIRVIKYLEKFDKNKADEYVKLIKKMIKDIDNVK